MNYGGWAFRKKMVQGAIHKLHEAQLSCLVDDKRLNNWGREG